MHGRKEAFTEDERYALPSAQLPACAAASADSRPVFKVALRVSKCPLKKVGRTAYNAVCRLKDNLQ